jgi:D-tyrosyl-tRNA(Tyr) deacylase
MRALIQRVSEAGVTVSGRPVSGIGPGLVVLLGVMSGDTDAETEYMVRKVSQLRIFEDSEGKMNLSLLDTGGEALVVSQFTLAADTRKGNRPSFVSAESLERANAMYEDFMARLSSLGIKVSGGEFGAMMDVRLVNQGPVTIMLETPARDKT